MPFRATQNEPGLVIVAASDTPAAKRSRASYRCDGTDDQLVIQAAIDSIPDGGRVFLLEGTYNLTGTVELVDDVVLEGEGRSTHLSSTVLAIRALNVSGPGVRQLRISGPGTGGSIDGVLFDGSSDGEVEGVEIGNFRYAVHLTGASVRARVSRCRIGPSLNGVEVAAAATDPVIEGNTIGVLGPTTDRDIHTLAPRSRVANNHLAGGGGIALYVEAGADDSIVMGNHLDATGNSSGIVSQANRVVIAFNRVIGASEGIRTQFGSNHVVVGNLTDLTLFEGLDIDGNWGLFVANLILRAGQNADNQNDAVQLKGDDNAVVANAVKHMAEVIQARDGLDVQGQAERNFVTDNDLRSSGRTNSLVNSGTGTVTTSANQT